MLQLVTYSSNVMNSSLNNTGVLQWYMSVQSRVPLLNIHTHAELLISNSQGNSLCWITVNKVSNFSPADVAVANVAKLKLSIN